MGNRTLLMCQHLGLAGKTTSTATDQRQSDSDGLGLQTQGFCCASLAPESKRRPLLVVDGLALIYAGNVGLSVDPAGRCGRSQLWLLLLLRYVLLWRHRERAEDTGATAAAVPWQLYVPSYDRLRQQHRSTVSQISR